MEDGVFKALADPSRRALLDRLFERNGQTLQELCEGIDMTRFGVMKHLRLLAEAGLVTTRKVGRAKHHYLNPVPIRLIHDRWVSKYAAPVAAALVQLKHTLEGTMGGDAVQVYEVFIRTTPERLWQALTEPALTRQYPFFLAIDSTFRVGDPVRYVDETGRAMVAGEVLEAEPPRRLAYTWEIHYDPALAHERSRVTWLIEPRGELCRLTLVHDVTGAPLTAKHVAVDGWSLILSGIKTLLETDEPMPLERPQEASR